MNSNLTPAEQWRLHGTFNEETVDRLLSLNDVVEDLDTKWACSAIREAQGCLPKENVLTPHLRRIAFLVKSTRGANREAAQEIFNDLHQLAEELRQQTEHAHEELNKVQNQLVQLN